MRLIHQVLLCFLRKPTGNLVKFSENNHEKYFMMRNAFEYLLK